MRKFWRKTLIFLLSIVVMYLFLGPLVIVVAFKLHIAWMLLELVTVPLALKLDKEVEKLARK